MEQRMELEGALLGSTSSDPDGFIDDPDSLKL